MSLTVKRDLDALRPGIEAYLGRPIQAVRHPAPGFSCETLIVDDAVVLRLPPIGDGIFPTYDLAQQAAVQTAAADVGVPVALPVEFVADESYLGTPFVAMPFVAGQIPKDFTPADKWLQQLADDAARHGVWAQTLDAVARVHTAATDALGLRAGLAAELAFWRDYVAWACDGAPPAGLAAALAWCDDHCPTSEPAGGLLWGDVRFGNVVYDSHTAVPRAVLDWDMASVGPAEMDVAWLLALEAVQLELTNMRVAGFGDRAEAITRFETLHGRELVDLDWHETFALVRASAISTRIAILFERAGEPTMFKVGEDPTLAAALRRIEG